MSNKIVDTVQGQMWDMHAKEWLGKEHFMRDIVGINVEYADLLIFSGDIPIEIDVSKKEPEQTLPPWEL